MRYSRLLLVALAAVAVTACATTETTKDKNAQAKNNKIKVCKKVRRTGSKMMRTECKGDALPQNLGVIDREEYRHMNRGGLPTANN